MTFTPEIPAEGEHPAGEPIQHFALQNIRVEQDRNFILRDVSLSIRKGEIYAIVGDHGSGKSTIGSILGGYRRPDSGRIWVAGKAYASLSPRAASRAGIEMVHQQINLIDDMTITENLLMPNQIRQLFPYFNRNRMYRYAQTLLAGYGFSYEPKRKLRELPLSGKMVIYILRSIINNPQLLILDDSLEKLNPQDYGKILASIRHLKDNGMAVLYITNRIDYIYNFAETVSIVRNGEIVLTDSVSNIDRLNLIRLCYSQAMNDSGVEKFSEEFHQLLKYNEAILQKLPTNLIVTDEHNRIRLVNEMGKKYFDIDPSDLRNVTLVQLLQKNDAAVLGMIDEAMKDQKEHVFYNVPLTLRNRKAVTNIRLLPIFDGQFLIGNIFAIEDISEQEKMREHVILTEKLASVGLLAAGVAHEINNPLEIIYNYLSYIRLETSKEKIERSIPQIEEEIESIKQIVSNLISFSDNDRRGQEVFDINEVIHSLIELLEFHGRRKDVKFQFLTTTEHILFRANRNEIKQVILNLVKNSFEVLSRGGCITIETSADDVSLLIIVGDTGPGIAETDQKDIFLPFFSKKKDSGGTGGNLGLGLSVSYGIIKKYDGTITVRNKQDHGCEFVISLPRFISDEAVQPPC